jgi:4'-phosphopantetheinyl transferase EntD
MALCFAGRTLLLVGCVPRGGWLSTNFATRRRRSPPTAFRCLAAGAPVLKVAPPFTTSFEFPVDNGVCVGVRLPSMDAAVETRLPISELHPDERDVMDGMQPARRILFAGGRVAMRRALTLLDAPEAASAPVLPDGRGAPTVAGGALGSISHTDGLAVALACTQTPPVAPSQLEPSSSPLSAVGVDVESIGRELSPRLARRCLHDDERATLGATCLAAGRPPSAATDLLLRVCIKEAMYKALHPLVRERFTIRWHAVRARPALGGTCEITIPEVEKELCATIDARAQWHEHDGYFVAIASATRAP